jgi:hypothetical protein
MYKEVVDYYNNGQDEIVVKNIDNKNVVFNYNPNTGNYRIYKIGFYEWLFNPEYKVFEVFPVERTEFKMHYKKCGTWGKPVMKYKDLSVQEILDYLKKQIKEGE